MVFSATMPQYIQNIVASKAAETILIDLVGSDTIQIPERIEHICVVCDSE
jgi:superfamily II DNA/RNA helicase